MKRLFFGHHKCGTTWIVGYLNQLSTILELKHRSFHSIKHYGYDLKKAFDDLDFISLINCSIRDVEQLEDFRGFHIIRDPRDILVSAYFSHLNTHSIENWSELEEHRKELQSMSSKEGLLFSFDFSDRLPIDGHDCNVMKSLGDWNYQNPKIIEIKFEEITASPYAYFIRIFSHLDFIDGLSYQSNKKGLRYEIRRKIKTLLNINSVAVPSYGLLLELQYQNSFEKLSGGRKVGQKNTESHYRKGGVGDWKLYFDKEHKSRFKEKYPNLLVKLGYEKNEDW